MHAKLHDHPRSPRRLPVGAPQAAGHRVGPLQQRREAAEAAAAEAEVVHADDAASFQHTDGEVVDKSTSECSHRRIVAQGIAFAANDALMFPRHADRSPSIDDDSPGCRRRREKAICGRGAR